MRRLISFLVTAAMVVALGVPLMGVATAQPSSLGITPGADSAPAFSCNAFTVTARSTTGVEAGANIDILVTQADTDLLQDLQIAFCDPDAAAGPGTTPDAPGPAAIDCDDDTADNGGLCPGTGTGTEGPASITGQGVTTSAGTFTFGVTSNEPGNMNIAAFFENNNNGRLDPAEPFANAVNTWTPAPRPSECSDNVDNDRDGLVDFPNDPGCANAADDSEAPNPGIPPTPVPAQCNDGLDNDADGLVDFPGDPGCEAAGDQSELNTVVRNVATGLTIRYNNAARAFKGMAGSSRKQCQVGRKVILRKARRGRTRVVGRDVTNRAGNWHIDRRRARGRFFAVAQPKTFTAANGDTINCLKDRSVTLRLRRG